MPTPRPDFKPSILLCSPVRHSPGEHGDEVPEPVSIRWHRAMRNLAMPFGYNMGEIHIDGEEVGDARNMAVRKARELGAKYLMFIDTDTAPPPNGLQLLVWQLDNRPEYDVAAGFYCNKSFPSVPLIWTEWGRGVHWDFTLGDTIFNVVGCTAGCMLLRLSLFDRLPTSDDDPWFRTLDAVDEEKAPHGYHMTEDIFFCKRAVEEAGAKILVDTRVYCEHIDWKTGRVYQLADDSLPVRRLAEKLGEAA